MVWRKPHRGAACRRNWGLSPAFAPNVIADSRGTFQWSFSHVGFLTDMIKLKPCLDAPRVLDEKKLFVLQCVPDSAKGWGWGVLSQNGICGYILEGERGSIYE